LNLYPLVSSLNVQSLNHLSISITFTSILMAMTFRLAFSNPLDCFIEKILSDANSVNEAECEMVTDNRSILDMMCESITHISQVLAQTKDITFNVRSELTNLRSILETTQSLSEEIKEVKKNLLN